jgi:hypothetical protein
MCTIMMKRVCLSVYGVTLDFETDSQMVFDEFIKEWGSYAGYESDGKGGKLSVLAKTKVDLNVPEGAIRDSIVFPSTAMYFHEGNILLVKEGEYFIRIDPAECEAHVFLRSSSHIFEKMRFIAKRFIIRLLEDKGIVSIHGSAAGSDKGALLFAGASGSGKTTSLLALLEKGCRMVADDVILVGDEVVLPFYLRSMIHKDTLKRFPSLSSGMANSGTWVPEADGWWIDLEDIYPVERKPTVPKAIFYTHVWNSKGSSCKEAEPSKMLSNLVRNYSAEAGIIFSPTPEQLKRVFSVYSKIVEKVPCYDLYIGNDLKSLSGTIQSVKK